MKTAHAKTTAPPPQTTAKPAAHHPPLSLLPPVQEVEAEPLSRFEKRRHLAQIISVNLLDCFDDSGAFDLARAKRLLPPCAIQNLVVHETTKTDKQGNTTVQRRITLRLVDKIRAMRLDDTLEDKQEKAALAEALQSINHLEKALAEADDRELRASRDLDEKDRQIETLKRASQPTEAPSPSLPSLSSVQIPLPPTPELSDPEPAKGPESPDLKAASEAEKQRRKVEEKMIRRRIYDIEYHQSTSAPGPFSAWYPNWPQDAEAKRAYARRDLREEAAAAKTYAENLRKNPGSGPVIPFIWPPPSRLHPMSTVAQGLPKFH